MSVLQGETQPAPNPLLPHQGRDSAMSTNIQNPQLHDALRSWIQVVAPSMISRPWFQGEDASSRQLDIDLMHVNSPIHRLEETQALFDIAAQTPEFLWHAAQQPQTGAPG